MTVVVSVQHGSFHVQLLFYCDSFPSHLVSFSGAQIKRNVVEPCFNSLRFHEIRWMAEVSDKLYCTILLF